jgi:hypothetical protein
MHKTFKASSIFAFFLFHFFFSYISWGAGGEENIIEPTPNGYGFFISNPGFYRNAVDKIFEKAEQVGKERPLAILEPGAGKGAFLKKILTDERNAMYPVRYTATELSKTYQELDSIIKTHSKHPENWFGQAKKEGSLQKFLGGKEAQYDVVAPFMVLHFIPPWQLPSVLDQIHTSLRPDGLFMGMVKIVPPESFDPVARPHYARLAAESLWPSFYGFSSPKEMKDEAMFVGALSIQGGQRTASDLFMTAFMPDTLRTLLETFGFKVESCAEHVETVLDIRDRTRKPLTYLSFIASKREERDDVQRKAYLDEGKRLEPLFKTRLREFEIKLPDIWFI